MHTLGIEKKILFVLHYTFDLKPILKIYNTLDETPRLAQHKKDCIG